MSSVNCIVVCFTRTRRCVWMLVSHQLCQLAVGERSPDPDPPSRSARDSPPSLTHTLSLSLSLSNQKTKKKHIAFFSDQLYQSKTPQKSNPSPSLSLSLSLSLFFPLVYINHSLPPSLFPCVYIYSLSLSLSIWFC